MTRSTHTAAIVSLMALVALAAVLYAQDTDAPASPITVRAVGLSIAIHDGSDNEASSLAKFVDAGTSLHLLVDFGDQTALEVIEDDSTIDAFTDDVGTVLLEPGEAERFGFLGLRGVEIADDGKTAQFIVTTHDRPGAGATTITLTASVAFVLGSDLTTDTLDAVAFKPGQTITAGDHAVEIKSVGKPSWGDAQLEIEFTSEQSFAGIAAMRFLDADGKLIESEVNSNSRVQMGKYVVYGRTIQLAKAADAVTIEIDYYATTETVTVPVDVTVGLGL